VDLIKKVQSSSDDEISIGNDQASNDSLSTKLCSWAVKHNIIATAVYDLELI
jgi:hypothetical protein